MKRAGVALLAVVVLLLVVQGVLPTANCRRIEVDISTGRIRNSLCLLFCPVYRRTENSPVTDALPADYLRNANPEWRTVGITTPGMCVIYTFSGACAQIHGMADFWRAVEASPALRERMARHLLALWRYANADSGAIDYVQQLSLVRNELEKWERTLAALATLEMPKIEAAGGGTACYTFFFPDGRPMWRFHAYTDAGGKLVRHGLDERWNPWDGTLTERCHYQNGKLLTADDLTKESSGAP